MRFRLLVALTGLILAHQPLMAQDYLNESPEERDARISWWRDARFGLFIHWGAYAVPAGTHDGERTEQIGEWIMHHLQIPVAEYEEYVRQFNPTQYDPEAWVRLAKQAGMKYIIITSKHHEGFALWDSEVSDYDFVDATPFKRDALKELAQAAEREGIRLGFYHSIMDWHHPDAQAPHYPTYNTGEKKNPNFGRYVETYLKPQLRELLSGEYGDVAVLWFDGEWIPEWTEAQGRDLYNFVRSLDPDIIINNRVGTGRDGMRGLNKGEGYAGDFGTPEQEIPDTGLPGIDWETCMTINDSWGFKSFDHNWKSTETLIRQLIDAASKGGNYLLNVGPTAEGVIPPESVERLTAMGRWMKVNGEAIYGTSASPLPRPSWGRFTAKPGRLYAHVFDWPEDGVLVVDGLEGEVARAYLLGDESGRALRVNGSSVRLPEAAPDPIASVVVLELAAD